MPPFQMMRISIHHPHQTTSSACRSHNSRDSQANRIHQQGISSGGASSNRKQLRRHITAFHSSTRREVLPSQQLESAPIQYRLIKPTSKMSPPASKHIPPHHRSRAV
ncbi:hypothetical protein Nepgr_017419 [Nepenthes gracilis]|uniref:Uncharacterized protein n=1 Tax=Nepenthes gracilis TaxID=150966 RepID=A0AAD3SQC8_NEPGR|nr:hypothetical protein Nepgr_017419 [Nepenthes gracilis]